MCVLDLVEPHAQQGGDLANGEVVLEHGCSFRGLIRCRPRIYAAAFDFSSTEKNNFGMGLEPAAATRKGVRPGVSWTTTDLPQDGSFPSLGRGLQSVREGESRRGVKAG